MVKDDKLDVQARIVDAVPCGDGADTGVREVAI